MPDKSGKDGGAGGRAALAEDPEWRDAVRKVITMGPAARKTQ
jgi:hypothetical protein